MTAYTHTHTHPHTQKIMEKIVHGSGMLTLQRSISAARTAFTKVQFEENEMFVAGTKVMQNFQHHTHADAPQLRALIEQRRYCCQVAAAVGRQGRRESARGAWT